MRTQCSQVPTPGIEAPVDAPHLAFVIDDEVGAGISHPGIVGGQFDETYARGQLSPGIGNP